MINFYNNLGMMRRAQVLLCGEKLQHGVRKNNVDLLIVAKDASDKTKKRWMDACHYYDCDIIEYGDREQLSKAIGKTNIVAVGITDKAFANNIRKQLKEVVL